jgi:Ni/Fe-hydrogenase subunit HybB-like protein
MSGTIGEFQSAPEAGKTARHTYRSVHDQIMRNIRPVTRGWWIGFFLLFAGVLLFFYCESRNLRYGQGVNGMKNPVMWGLMIVNFVFWIGIGHAGTLISAILFLLRSKFRTAVARSAEAMTVFAVMTAGLFPLFHLGRTWLFYTILPFPNQRSLWPNFISALVFDVCAISTYATVSLLFWYTGLIPDFAAARDRFTGLRGRIYNLLSLGWRNNNRNWRHYTRSYLFFAAMATPLVISVHSVVSWDFGLINLPGWHSTIFPPFFVAGAIHSGFAAVMVLLIPVRKYLQLETIITMNVLEKMAKVILFTGLLMGYSYAMEVFTAFYSQNLFEIEIVKIRAMSFGYIPYWVMILCNAVAPLLFISKKIRQSRPWLIVIGLLVLIGMWYERYVIIITQARAYIPYNWRDYFPSLNEIGLTVGSFCWFGMWFWIFLRFAPVVSIVELKEDMAHSREGGEHGEA